MRNAQLKTTQLEHLAEYYKGNPVINDSHVISAIHDENPDMAFPQIPKLMELHPSPATENDEREDFLSRQASLASSTSHTPAPEVLGLRPEALNDFLNKTHKNEKWQRKALHYIKEDFGSQTPKGGLCRFQLALAYEKQPYLTPRDVIFKHIASMPRNTASRFQTNLQSSDVDAFILNHEVGHRRSYEFGLSHKENVSGAENSSEFQKLQNKKDQVSLFTGAGDPYGRYLEEAFSDTFAALQHLKNGGSPEFVKTISDAREHGFMKNTNAYIYPTHSTLRAITKKPRILQETLVGTNQEDVVRMAAGIVGEHSYDREEYYEHAMVAQVQAMTGNKASQVAQADAQFDWEEIIQDKDAPAGKLWQGFCSNRPTGFRAMFSRKGANTKPVDQFVADAYAKHGAEDAENYLQAKRRLTNAPEAKPDHFRAELLGHIKYVASKYPDKMPEELLREREAYLREEYKQLGREVPRDTQFINEDVRDHLAAQRAEKTERERAAVITRGEMEPDHDLNHAPER